MLKYGRALFNSYSRWKSHLDCNCRITINTIVRYDRGMTEERSEALKSFWVNVIKTMELREISWNDLASRIGTTKNNLASLKAHNSNVSLALAAEIARNLNTSLDELYFGTRQSEQEYGSDFLKRVFEENLKIFKEGYYRIGTSTIRLPDPPASIYYEHEFKKLSPWPIVPKAFTEVVLKDTLEVARELCKENPLVLCMSDRRSPDDKARKGLRTHAAHILRSSNYYVTLDRIREKAFPMNRNYGGIYSPSITVFRDLEENGYRLLAEPYQVSFVAVAALYRPDLDAEGNYLDDRELEGMKNKIRTILNIAVAKMHTVLVLSSLGCGASGNPPQQVAMLFKEILNEPRYAHSFERIVFAIKDKNTYEVFSSVFR